MLTYPLKGERVYSRHLGYRTGTKEQRKSQHHLRQWYLHSHRSSRGLSVYRPGQGDLTFSHHYVPLASSPTISYHTGVTHEYMPSAPDKPSSNQRQHHNFLEHVHPVGNLLYPPPVLRLLYNTPFNTYYRVREAKSLSPGRGVCVGGGKVLIILHTIVVWPLTSYRYKAGMAGAGGNELFPNIGLRKRHRRTCCFLSVISTVTTPSLDPWFSTSHLKPCCTNSTLGGPFG